ncbi:hypothetical protein [Acidovorax sp.]|uniref:hypothetical protein n=1 Tax=Acidovorax sp. TaxID=1872122 RepID=UPI0025BB83E8|nr:hypothetical protein [Acidovorax sp.]
MDVFDQIADGVRPLHSPRDTRTRTPCTGVQLQLSYALAKQIPDMARGFTVHTSFGEIAVVAGPLAQQIQALVREATERELAACGAQP